MSKLFDVNIEHFREINWRTKPCFYYRVITRFSARRFPSAATMAAPNPAVGVPQAQPAEDHVEAMDVDPQASLVILKALKYSGATTADLLRTVGRKPDEVLTEGDMQHLGELFTNCLILSTEAALNARQIEADDEAARRRREMAADADFSDELNDMFDELFPLESCVPADNKHMGKQISSLAAKMREKKRLGGLKMDSAADWIRSRQELEETFRDARLGSKNMAKCWLAFEVASPSTRTNLKDAGIIKVLQNSPKTADYNKHFVEPQNYCFKVLSTSANARNSLHRQQPQQVAHEDVSTWHRRLVALGTEALGDIGQWSRESRSVVTNCFIRRSRHVAKLAMYVNRTMLEAANATT